MRFLFVTPHPDDLEFNIPSIMFSIAHYQNLNEYSGYPEIQCALARSKEYFSMKSQKRFQFKAVSMTRGEMAELTDEVQSTLKAAEIRSNELIEGQKILTGKKPDFLGFFDGYVKVNEESIQKLYDYIVSLQPDYIIGPEPVFYFYIHEDHLNTGKILYHAVKKIVQAKNRGILDISIPKLFYYQSIYNHWFFPRFPAFENILLKALRAHKSQYETTEGNILNNIVVGIEKLLKGTMVKLSTIGEALRFQPIPDNPDESGKIHIKKFSELPFWIRILHYVLKKLQILLRGHDYEKRYDKYFDGTMPESISATWD